MPDSVFRYSRTATGSLSGASLIQQTEDAINDLTGQVVEGNRISEETTRTAQLALANSQTAMSNASNALTTAQAAQSTANTAAQSAAQAVQSADNALTQATGAAQAAQAAAADAQIARSQAQDANTAAQEAAQSSAAAQEAANTAQVVATNAQTAAEAAQAAAQAAATEAQQAVENAVKVTPQVWTDSQQEIARQNIGAASIVDTRMTGNATAENLRVSGTLDATSSRAIGDENGSNIYSTYATKLELQDVTDTFLDFNVEIGISEPPEEEGEGELPEEGETVEGNEDDTEA